MGKSWLPPTVMWLSHHAKSAAKIGFLAALNDDYHS
jgi:hypothetical protein